MASEMKYNKQPVRRKSNRTKRSKGDLLGPGRNDLVSGGSRNATLLYEPFMPVFPPKIIKVMRYSTSISLSSAAGVVTTYVFRANDLFDPDFTSTGHQPMGFDQIMTWFNHFCVLRASIRVTFKNRNGTSTPTCCIRQDAASTPIAVIDRIVELGGCVLGTLNFFGQEGGNMVLSLNLDVRRLQGVSISAITADPTLRGDAATSPTEVTYFHVAIWDTQANTGSVLADVELVQEAAFMEPRDEIES